MEDADSEIVVVVSEKKQKERMRLWAWVEEAGLGSKPWPASGNCMWWWWRVGVALPRRL